ncbi:MAG: glycosyltransferase family 39 protein [Crocinitomicaceae bacterium]|nr:glycosyltransferase family 39 protein [Crocinitomicaceae bacterium]MDG1657161.1 glycosyltransferase family 39 protein [Crocinitomicaceae bacterium]
MPYLGIILVIATVLFGRLSWVNFRRGNYSIALTCLVLIGLMLRLFVASDLFLHPWDERYHALVAKNMLSHPLVPTLYDSPILDYDYKNWPGNHVWLHKQPLALWGIMASLWTFGTNEIAVRIPSIILSTLGIVLTYKMGWKLFNRQVGYYGSILYAINGLIVEMMSGRITTDHVDIFFLFFIQLAILLAIEFAQTRNKWINLLCGFTIGLAVLSKWLPALIVFPVWFALIKYYGKFTWKEIVLHGILLLTIAFVTFIPWQVYIHQQFPLEAVWESNFNRMHLTEAIEGQSGPFYYHFSVMRIVYGEIIYIPLIWLLWVTLKKRSNSKYWALLLWIGIPYIFFSLVATKMQAYTLFAAPAIFIVAALFIHYLIVNKGRFRYKWLPVLLVVLLFALPIRFAIERIKPFNEIDRNPEWRRELLQFSEKIKDDEKAVVFNVELPIELMFYSGIPSYLEMPEDHIIDSLLVEGYTIYFGNHSEVEHKYENANYFTLVKKGNPY